jgi:IMP dehydrogenase/GMP reductase
VEIPLGLSYDDVLLVPKMTPLGSRSQADPAGWITPTLKLPSPFLSANMDTVTNADMAIALARLGGMGVIHQFQSPEKEAAEVARVKSAQPGGLPAAAAVGIADGLERRVQAVIAAGADLIVVDAAHGHSPFVAAAVAAVKKMWPKIPVLAGNIATAAGAEFLIAAGADALKVGIGPGSVCTTRIIAGAGVPQLTAILSVRAAIKKFSGRKIGLAADGGIKQPGDAVKALAAGASCVMGGNIFAGAAETPGKIIVKNGKKYKKYQGSSTVAATKNRIKLGGGNKGLMEQWSRVEGVEALVPYRGPVKKIIERYLGGIRSGLSYAGAGNLRQLQKNAQFIRITSAGWRESLPHDIVI